MTDRPLRFKLLALETFRPGQKGVVTNEGVRHLDRMPHAYDAGVMLVVAVEHAFPMTHCQFEEVIRPKDA